MLRKRPADFSYLVINGQTLTPARRKGRAAPVYRIDRCMIVIAEKIAETKSAVLFDQGGLLLVRVSSLPDVTCD